MSTSSRADATSHPVVLVVEDEPVLRASMVRGLSKLGTIEVVDAGTVREARELSRALDVAMLVSDLDLPDGSGVELLGDVERRVGAVPVLFVSAFVREFRGLLPSRPNVSVLEKPVSLDRLRREVEKRVGTGPTSGVSPFSVPDFVQLAAMGRRSVAIEVRRGGHLVGRVVIRGGDAWSARDGAGTGLGAFRRLAFLSDAEVTCVALAGDSGMRDLEGSCENLLLEAARQQDERHRSGVPDPPVAFASGPAALRDLPADDDWDVDVEVDEAPTTAPSRGDDASDDRGDRAFDAWYEDGVDALLARAYERAYDAFARAHELRPGDARVIANLARLRELGFGPGGAG